jgi:hypothetical protein
VVRAIAALVVLAACGRVGFDALGVDASVPDANHDANANCTFGPWSPPTRVVELSSSSNDFDPAFTDDGLGVIFSTDRVGTLDMYASTRTARGAPWSTPQPIAELATASDEEANPSLSADGLELYFGLTSVYRMTRSSGDEPFSNLVEIVPDGAEYTTTIGPEISRDGLHLYFSAIPTGASTERQMYRLRRTSLASPFTGLQRLPSTDLGVENGFPCVSPDELELYYSRDVPTWDLRRMTRASTDVEFDPATDERLDVLDSGAGDADADISSDGREMLFGSDRSGGPGLYDLYVSTRDCE